MTDPKNLTEDIKAKAREIGFDLVGIADASPHPHFSIFDSWLQKGFHGSMAWLERGREKRGDPQLVLPGAKSFICVGLNYYRGHARSVECQDKDRGWISNYAWGDDYHDVVLEKLRLLETHLSQLIPAARYKSYVDTGPVLERSYSASAGLGWIGKNTLLINPKMGSTFFIGVILTDLNLTADSPEPDHCGTCTRCMDACPTQALTPYELDSNKCISYLTIEHRGEIKEELAAKVGPHLVGCDICQDVCPWNRKTPLSSEAAFDPRPGNFHPSLDELVELSPEGFAARFKGSPVKRVKREGLLRNVAMVRKNSLDRGENR